MLRFQKWGKRSNHGFKSDIIYTGGDIYFLVSTLANWTGKAFEVNINLEPRIMGVHFLGPLVVLLTNSLSIYLYE